MFFSPSYNIKLRYENGTSIPTRRYRRCEHAMRCDGAALRWRCGAGDGDGAAGAGRGGDIRRGHAAAAADAAAMPPPYRSVDTVGVLVHK
jgi:hypothetical protein